MLLFHQLFNKLATVSTCISTQLDTDNQPVYRHIQEQVSKTLKTTFGGTSSLTTLRVTDRATCTLFKVTEAHNLIA